VQDVDMDVFNLVPFVAETVKCNLMTYTIYIIPNLVVISNVKYIFTHIIFAGPPVDTPTHSTTTETSQTPTVPTTHSTTTETSQPPTDPTTHSTTTETSQPPTDPTTHSTTTETNIFTIGNTC
jgi:hypothetical protein